MQILMIAEGVHQDRIRGGVQAIIYNLSRQFVREGHQVTILTRRHKRGDKFLETADGVRIWRFPAPSDGSIFYFAYPFFSIFATPLVYLFATLRLKADIVVYHHPFSAFGIELLGLARNTKRVFVFHAPRSVEYEIESSGRLKRVPGPIRRAFVGLVKLLERTVVARVDRVVVLSKFMKRQLCKTHPGLRTPTVPISAGVDEDRFAPAPDRQALREKLGLPIEATLLFTARRLVARMGLENLLEAFRVVVQNHQDVLLLIAGSGYLKRALEERIDTWGLNDQVRLLGFVSDEELVLYYQCADLFVLPTEHLEGYGLVLMEAFSTGTPVIATPVGAIPEILGEFNPHLLCRDNSPDAVAEKLLQALRTPEMLELYKDYRSLVLEAYTWRHISHKYLSLFKDLMNASGKASV